MKTHTETGGQLLQLVRGSLKAHPNAALNGSRLSTLEQARLSSLTADPAIVRLSFNDNATPFWVLCMEAWTDCVAMKWEYGTQDRAGSSVVCAWKIKFAA